MGGLKAFFKNFKSAQLVDDSYLQDFTHLSELQTAIMELPSDFLLVVTEKNIKKLYENFFHSLQVEMTSSKKIAIWTGDSGEELKSFKALQDCLEFFLQENPHRQCMVVAIGGGAVTDFGGLVASLLLRGVDWISVPTTFLGMIDASLGGKVAINSVYGKNLIGSFHLPRSVFFAHEFLQTLPPHEWRNGAGELMKYFFLEESFYPQLKLGDSSDTSWRPLIKKAAIYKMKIVAHDPFELKETSSGQIPVRKVLNFGHTFGHAFEKILASKGFGHGECVLLGMEMILELFGPQELMSELEDCCQQFSWPKERRLRTVYAQMNLQERQAVFTYLRGDKKKNDEETISLILLEKRGVPKIQSVSFREIEARMEKWSSELLS